MKALKYLAIALVVYAGLVAAFESLLGYFQPSGESTIVLTTFDEDGAHDRVVTPLDTDGKLYVGVNHWPRAWYYRALENPEVKVTRDGEQGDYLAVPVEGEEHERVEADNQAGWVFKILTGFAPRYFVRLDPKA